MDNEALKIWDEVKEMFKIELTDLSYNTWISKIKPISYYNNTFVVFCPNGFTLKMIDAKYKSTMEDYLKLLLEKDIRVELVDPSTNDLKQKVSEFRNEKLFNSSSDEDTSKGESTVDMSKDSLIYKRNKQLNSKYTFENFVSGKSNQFALATAIAVAEAPGTLYNPLFIYGGAGLGKTHLMRACAHKITENFPEKKVMYMTSESFTNELIKSINTRKNDEFRSKYRQVDVLLIDDIQFIEGKAGTQEEFFHTFNELYNNNKQIIICSDRPPKEIKNLESRLVSRFEWGLIADVQQPDFETRVAILDRKAEEEHINLPHEVIEYLAQNIVNNIRELEGAMNKLKAYMSLDPSAEMSLDQAKMVLNSLMDEKSTKSITIELIKDCVVDFYGLEKASLESKDRSRKIAFPRQVAMYLSRKLTDLSLLKIADSFSRDHSTILHGIDKITEQIDKNNDVKEEVDSIIKIIREK